MYQNFYNLHCKPFENTPDPDFLFLSAQHQEALSSLLYGIEESKGFILISGSVGTGKTTIVRSFLQKTASEHIIINIINPKTSFNDVLELLAKKLAIAETITNQLELLETMKVRLLELSKKGIRAIILIDEAHLLPESALEEIRLLSNIEHEKEKLIQIVLVGQNEIYDLLEREKQKSLKQRIVINRQISPLSTAETKGYIKHRLQMAGNNQTIFTKDALTLVWKKSHGTPRLINHICDNALLIGYATEASMITKSIILEVIQDMGKKSDLPAIVTPVWLSNKSYLAIAASCVLALGLFWGGGQPDSSPHNILPPHSSAQTTKTPVDLVTPPNITPSAGHPVAAPEKTAPKSLAAHTIQPRKMLPVRTTKKKIRPGDSLFDIAYRNYGTMSETIIDYIQQANGINDINIIYSGQKIRLPQITPSTLISKNASNRFHVHYASFYSSVSAVSVAQRLENMGEDVSIEESTYGNNKIYRVYVGDFPDRTTAKAKLKTLDFKYLHFLTDTKFLALNK